MANKEHVAKLKEGVEAWNLWRDQYDQTFPDLSRADLSGADLHKINLSRAHLEGTNLSDTLIEHGDFTGGAFLNDANLINSHMSWCRLMGADRPIDRSKPQRSKPSPRGFNWGHSSWGQFHIGYTH